MTLLNCFAIPGPVAPTADPNPSALPKEERCILAMHMEGVLLERMQLVACSWTSLPTQLFGEASSGTLVVRIDRPTSLAIWHRGCSHRRPNRNGSPNRRHFASLDLKNTPIFRIAGQHRRIFTGFFFRAFSCDFRSSECVFASLAKKSFSHR